MGADEARVAAETAASTAEDHRAHVDSIRDTLDEAAQSNVAPYLTQTALNATYGTKAELATKADAEDLASYATTSDLAAVTAGMVSSPQELNVVLTDDPDYSGSNGDLVFRYQTWRTFLDLGATGLTPLTPRAVTSPRWTAEAGFVRHGAGTTLRTAQAVAELDAQPDRTDVEIVCKMRVPSYGPTYGPSVIVRGSGSNRDITGISLSMTTTGIALGYFIVGTWTTLFPTVDFTPPTNTWVWLRLRAIGGQISIKYWVDGATEPSGWARQYTVTNSALLQPGWAGITATSSQQMDFAAIGVAVAGATAPTSPL